MSLRFAAFFARFEAAGVPGFILGVDGAEPPAADTAMEGGSSVAGLVHG